ncbi:MAG: hypothetical protein VSS75_018030, partial [Candidatus Parabeggiatoa sp.]|nr:hypothetical protein [Candidatus Parabeggiatoa sp.]
HTLPQSGGNRHKQELESDQYSGFILQKMGASLNEALAAMKVLSSEQASSTHPGKQARLAAITKGWNESKRIDVAKNSQKPSNPTKINKIPAPQKAPGKRSNPNKYKRSIMSAIERAAAAFAQSQFYLDATPLGQVFTEKSLRELSESIKEQRINQVHTLSKLYRLQFDHFAISANGLQATVKVTETWESAIYSIQTRECLSYHPRAAIPQTVFLSRQSNRWLIYAVQFDGHSPQYFSCAGYYLNANCRRGFK